MSANADHSGTDCPRASISSKSGWTRSCGTDYEHGPGYSRSTVGDRYNPTWLKLVRTETSLDVVDGVAEVGGQGLGGVLLSCGR